MKNSEKKCNCPCSGFANFVKEYKKPLLVVLAIVSFLLYAAAYLGLATYCGENQRASAYLGINTTLAVVYFVGITIAYILLIIGIAVEKRFLVTVPLMALAAFVGSEFVSKISNAFIEEKINSGYWISFSVLAAVIDLILLAAVILYICGYLGKSDGCKKAINILLYVGLVVAIAETVLACFFQSIYSSTYGAIGWQYIILYAGFIVFYGLMILMINTRHVDDRFIVGVFYNSDSKAIKEDQE